MDDQDKRLLNAIQADFPLASRPFQALGASLALSEGEVIDRIASLKQQKVVRQISAIFDTRSLGYKSSLVAMRVQPDRLDAAAAVVNSHPGVSHNYKRNHAFNLWFTLAVPPSSDLQWTVERLHTMTGADSTRILPTLRLFKIGVQLDMEGKSGAEREEPREAGYSDVRRPAAGPAGLRGVDIAAIHELQGDFPLVPEPYRPMADRMGLSEESLFEVARHLQGQGYLRRVAAVLHHREAGFRANAMGVWVVPPQRAEEVGKIMGSFRGVSHCYLRPTYPDWLYNIFTMVHGQKAKDCQEIISAISAATGITEYALLYSTKEYKKVRLKYFTPELDEWEAQARQSAGAAPADSGMLAANPR
ncbi:MAG: Lrp/AsnC family transcriptional regulator [candidate division NC10 bacterium]|nr:Lrp/AsnC family transcriptional regulator [candidate division NC10 bacterium]MBI2114825.1 Lrp/AsnC family transcriptional regulator [candidate division NC10 bacterium]MBI2162765.1 Lrp/AsnC family transcriptional regulator [candidate division NC10 bacterium]